MGVNPVQVVPVTLKLVFTFSLIMKNFKRK